jgi:two-component system chemotaxis sensor kinase CheA
MSSFADESLIQEFLAEGRDHLTSIEPDLLSMESGAAQAGSETVNRVFRAIHSIKGAAGFFGYENLKNLSHVMESVLMKVRDGALAIDSTIMDVLLAGLDILNTMFDDIQSSETIATAEVIAKCQSLLEGGPGEKQKSETIPVPSQEEETKQEFVVDANLLADAKKHGRGLYILKVSLGQDLEKKQRSPITFIDTLESTGTVLETQLDISEVKDLNNCLEVDLSWRILYSTVLEKDLLLFALDLPAEQVQDVENPQGEPVSKKAKEAARIASEETAATVQSEMPTEATPEARPASPAKEDKASPATGETIRVRVDILNQVMNEAGELVLVRNQLIRTLEQQSADIPGLSRILQNLDAVTSMLQERIMQTRLQPIGNVFTKIPRIVRDISHKMGKEIEIETTGGDVELDKSILELLSDPLTHIIRNCCDHGIETPDVRERAGKSRGGKIFLSAFHESGQVSIMIVDDGKGIDAEAVVRKAIASGAITKAQAEAMSPQERLNLIFLAGLSTAKEVSEVSGRGVGMDVVRANIEKLGGHIELESEVGVGTTVLLRLPLTLAIIPSLIVRVSGQRFAVPQVNITELVWIRAAEISQKIEKLGNADVLRLRGHLLPLVHLADVLGLERRFYNPTTKATEPDRRALNTDRRSQAAMEDSDSERRGSRGDRRSHWRGDLNILILKSGSDQFGIIVEELEEVEEIVVKPLSRYLKECKCFAGSTIMGDGHVVMILDAAGVSHKAQLSFSEVEAESRRREEERLRAASTESKKSSVLLFHNHPEELFAVPLQSLTRIEAFDLSSIEKIGEEEYVNLRGDAIPLIRLDRCLSARPFPPETREGYLIVPNDACGRAGILASQIVDTVEAPIPSSKDPEAQAGRIGSVILNNRLTQFLDPAALLASNLSRRETN